MTYHSESKILNLLVTKPLTKVEFVMDYITLYFSEIWISFLALPTLKIGGAEKPFLEKSHNTILWEHLGRKVVRTFIEVDKVLQLEFETGLELSISLYTDSENPRVETVLIGYWNQETKNLEMGVW